MLIFIQTISWLVMAGQRVAGWVWALSLGVLSLCALPWFEFAHYEHIWPTVATVALLTVTGLGPGYFSARVSSDTARRWLNLPVAVSRKLAKWLAVAGVALVVLYSLPLGYAGYPIIGLVNLYKTIADFPYRRPSTAQWLFRRGYATVQLRLESRGNMYNPNRWRAIVVWPLTSFFNFVTELPDGQPDSSWAVVRVPTPPLKQLPEGTLAWQADLRREADRYRSQLAERQRREAADAARILDTLHFELREANAFFSNARDSRFARLLLSDTLDNMVLYARLSPDQVLWVRATELGSPSEVFAFALTGFKGIGRYDLGNPPPPTSPDITGPGYAEFLRREQALEVAYVSTGAAPVQVVITRYDPVQQLVGGTFEGVLSNSVGQSITIKRGAFEVRYKPFRFITPN